jgi:hypothetical protein
MNLLLADIPDSHTQLVPWLEQQLIGMNLHQLVGELRLLAGTESAYLLLHDMLSDEQLAAIQQSGLSVLSESELRTLFRSPETLLELQEIILTQDSGYWTQLEISEAQQQLVDQSWKQIERQLFGKTETMPQVISQQKSATRTNFVTTLVTLTAVLFLGLSIIFWNQPTQTSGWGFSRSGVLTANLSAKEYLHSLSQAANDWFSKQPETPADLNKRLQQFRTGCEELLKSPHTQLAEADRAWLKERCQAWISKIDGHLADLAQDKKPFAEVKTQSNETIQKLIDALKARSETVS